MVANTALASPPPIRCAVGPTDTLAQHLRGAVIVVDGDGLVFHSVSHHCVLSADLVTAIIRRDTAGLIPSDGWRPAPWPGWVTAGFGRRCVFKPISRPDVAVVVADAEHVVADGRALDAILAEVSLLQECANGDRELALLRLVQGCPGVDDLEACGPTLVGARVVVLKGLDRFGVSMIRAQTTDHHHAPVVAVTADSAVALVRSTSERQALRLADRIARTAVLREASAGISTAVGAAADLPVAYRDAIDAAHLADVRGLAVLNVDEVWAEIAVERLRRAGHDLLPLSHPLARLRDHDSHQGCDLAATVAVWLKDNQITAAAAERLSIHANTLRYRLRRATALSGLDLDDPAQRLLAHLFLEDDWRRWQGKAGRKVADW